MINVAQRKTKIIFQWWTSLFIWALFPMGYEVFAVRVLFGIVFFSHLVRCYGILDIFSRHQFIYWHLGPRGLWRWRDDNADIALAFIIFGSFLITLFQLAHAYDNNANILWWGWIAWICAFVAMGYYWYSSVRLYDLYTKCDPEQRNY